MRIFITGGTGFIGRRVVSCLQGNDTEHNQCMILTRRQLPHMADTSITDRGANAIQYAAGSIGGRERMRDLMAEFKPDTLLHLAWDVAAADFATSPNNEKWVLWSKNLAEDFLVHGGQNVIASGTCFEYEWKDNKILTEESIIHPATFYGECKVRAYNAMKDLCAKYGARFAWGRVFYPYGPGEESRKLISVAIDTLRRGGEFTCRAPMNRIDYIHVDDVANCLALLVLNPAADGAYNICTGRATQVGDMLRYAAKKLGAEDKLHLCAQESPICVAGSNSAIIKIGAALKYTDIYKGLDTYF